MFGQNPVAPNRSTKATFLVKSIFDTIQGEGPYAGHCATFIRFGGCNLKCAFCDTDFTADLDEMSADEICEYLLHDSAGNTMLVFTGGEPMLQNLALLIKAISRQLPHVTHVQIETAGTVWPEGFNDVVHGVRPIVDLVVSPKTPKVNPSASHYAIAWKYIVKKGMLMGMDGIPLNHAVPLGKRPVYIQPMDEQDPIKNAANVEFAKYIVLRHKHRLSLQIHKIIGVE